MPPTMTSIITAITSVIAALIAAIYTDKGTP
jgi:hypothetical protein